MHASEEPDLAGRVYRIRWPWRAFAIVWTAIGALVWGTILPKEISGTEDAHLSHFVVAPLWIIGGILWTVHMLRATVTLSHDSIETRGLLGKARLRFNEIRGRREYVVAGSDEDGGDTHYLKVEPNDDRLPTLDLMRAYDFDTTFYGWFEKLPDLDAIRQAKGQDLE
jgi:hypothetical protein